MFSEETMRTIRNYLTIRILVIVFLTIIASTFISSRFIDDYFKSYIASQYEQNIQKILRISSNAIQTGTFTQIGKNLNPFIEDPIVGISISIDGKELISIQEKRAHMQMMMMNNSQIYSYDILSDKNQIIGQLRIFRIDNIQDYKTIILFKKALLRSNIIAFTIAGLLGIAAIIFASKKLGIELSNTAAFARVLESEKQAEIKYSDISEIKGIQLSLFGLSSRLGIKNNIRKEQADKLSHEVRTPLTILKANIEGMQDGILDMDSQRLETCINQVDILSSLLSDINNILSFDTSEIKINISRFDLIDELNQIVKGFKPQFNKKNIDIIVEGPKSMDINTDRQLLNQTLYNLLTNAYKFTSDFGKVSITAYQNEKENIIEIKDTGKGIDKKDIPKLFDAYYRGKNAGLSSGKGLGLYISASNIKALEGKIIAENNSDIGASFKIILKR